MLREKLSASVWNRQSRMAPPTLEALRLSMVSTLDSINRFQLEHSQWHALACAKPIIGRAWQDHLDSSQLGQNYGGGSGTFIEGRTGFDHSIKGLKAIRNSIQQELSYIERHIAKVGDAKQQFGSSNAFYLATSWQQVLLSYLSQAPVVQLDATFPTTPRSGNGGGEAAKVDIVCRGGNRWVRVLTIKPFSLLAEFRNAESYVSMDEDDDEDDEESDKAGDKELNGLSAEEGNERKRTSFKSMQAALEQGQIDSVAADCSVMRIVEELLSAAETVTASPAAAVNVGSNRRSTPTIEIVLTRLLLSSVDATMQDKFHDEAEAKRYMTRLAAMQRYMTEKNIVVSGPSDRRLKRCEILPSSVASGEVTLEEKDDEAACLKRMALPSLPEAPKMPIMMPTTKLNLDTSCLVALVSTISHMRLPSRTEDCDKYFKPEVLGGSLPAASGSGGAADEEEAFLSKKQPRAKTLTEQLQREMSGDGLFDSLTASTTLNRPLELCCTIEARDKLEEIIRLVGGPLEQQRASALFASRDEDADLFWKGSRWADDEYENVRRRIRLPVRIIDSETTLKDPPAAVATSSAANWAEQFEAKAKSIVIKTLEDLNTKAEGGAVEACSGEALRQTGHTLRSILVGLEATTTTVTTNMFSVKWLVKEVMRVFPCESSQGQEGMRDQELEAMGRKMLDDVRASLSVLYPRSLSERMVVAPGDESFRGEQGMTGAIVLQDNGAGNADRIEAMSDAPADLQRNDFGDQGANASSQRADGSYDCSSPNTPAERDTLQDFADTDHKTKRQYFPVRLTSLVNNLNHLPSSSSSSSASRSRSARRQNMTASSKPALPWKMLKSLIRGPRKPAKLTIGHYRWWPLAPIEAFWLRTTDRVAWKDPAEWSNGRARTLTFVVDDLESPRTTQTATMHAQTTDTDKEEEEAAESEGNRWWKDVKADVRLNWLHWLLLCAVYIGWILGFSFLVQNLWYQAEVLDTDGVTPRSAPQFFGCTTTYWLQNSNCGLEGEDCQPFSSNSSVQFRCPANCQTTTLGGQRAVGNQLPAYVPLVVGGTNVTETGPKMYRGDSFVCAAAIHAGVLEAGKGGCGSLWLAGASANLGSAYQHGINSTSYASSFPVNYFFDESTQSRDCTDRRSRGYILDVILLAFVGFTLRPKPIVYFYTLVCLGFWHINFISEPREYPMTISDPFGDFLPTLFVAYAIWRLTFRFIWPAFRKVPLEREVFTQGLFWIGTLLGIVFENVPLSRLVASDISNEPGALTSIIVIVVVAIVLAINQVRVIRKTGALPKYLTLLVIGGVIIALLAAVPTTGVRLHHYIIALMILPFCAFETRLSLIYAAFCLGMFLNGVGRWGFDGLIQDTSDIVGSGTTGSALPSFAAPNAFTGLLPYSSNASSTATDGLVQWEPIDDADSDSYDAFQLLVDDVLMYQGTALQYNLSRLVDFYQPASVQTQSSSSSSTTASSSSMNFTYYPAALSNINQTLASQPHYLRLAYLDTQSGSTGDFTRAATVYFNGTFIAPQYGAT